MINVNKLFNELARALEILAAKHPEFTIRNDVEKDDASLRKIDIVTTKPTKIDVQSRLIEKTDENDTKVVFFEEYQYDHFANARIPKASAIYESETPDIATEKLAAIVVLIAVQLSCTTDEVFNILENLDGRYRRPEKIIKENFLSPIGPSQD